MLCYIVLISAIYQHESAIGIYMSSLSWTSLPWTTPSCHSRLSQWFCCFVDDIFCWCCVKAFQFVIFPFIFVFVSCLRRHVVVVVVVELLSHVQLFATPPTGAHQVPCPSPSPGICSNSSALSQFTIQPSHPLSLPSPPAFSLSQHQCLFQRVSSSHQVAKVLELQLQHQSLQWIFRIGFLLGLRDLISLQYKGLSRVFSNTTVPNNSLMFSLLYGPNVTSIHDTGKTIALTRQTCHQNCVSAF